VRPATQRVRAREQIPQRRIFRRAGLDRPPRQVVKDFVLATIGCRKGALPAVVPLGAAGVPW
jgi:hypothetical protein